MTIEDEPNNPSDDQTLITGVHGVDVIAGNGSLNVSQNSHVLAVAIIPPQKAQTLGNQVNTGSIVSDAEAEIFAGIRNQSATPLTTSSSIPQLALVVNASDSTTWNANVVFTGQQAALAAGENSGSSDSLAGFSITAASGWTALGIPVAGLPNLVGIAYDSTTYTVTLQFDSTFSAAVIDLGISSADIHNSQGAALDGEWVNDVTRATPVTELPARISASAFSSFLAIRWTRAARPTIWDGAEAQSRIRAISRLGEACPMKPRTTASTSGGTTGTGGMGI